MDRRIPAVGLVLIAACCPQTGLAAGENLLANPSFEQTTDGRAAAWSWNHSWYAQPKDKGLATVSLDPTVFHAMGQRSLKIAGQGNRGLVRQALRAPFKPNDKFRLSGWIKIQDIRPACARIGVEFIGDKGKWLGHRGAATDWRIKTLDWKQHAVEFAVPEGTKHIYVNLSTDKPTNGTAWFDDMLLVRLSPPPKAKPAKPQPKPDIEGVIPLDDFEADSTKGWSADAWGKGDRPTLALSTDKPYRGKQALRLEFFGRGCHVMRRWPFKEPWDAITFRLRSVSGKGRLMVNVVTEPMTYFRAVNVRPAAEWSQVTIWADALRYGWGAKKDAHKTFNSRRTRYLEFAIDAPCAFELDHVKVYVRDQVGMLNATHANPGHVVEPGQPSQVLAKIYNTFTTPRALALDFVLRDIDGKEISRETKKPTLPRLTCQDVAYGLPGLEPGYYSVDVTLRDGARLVREWHVGVCSLPPAVRTGKGFFGASVFGAGDPKLAARVGVRRAGTFFCWKWQERRKGKFEIKNQKQIDALKQAGIEPIGFITVMASRQPKWAANPAKDADGKWRWQDDPADWEGYVRTVATMFHKDIKVWSMCCEVDLAYRRWSGDAAGYVNAVRRAYRVLKEVDPNCIVGGIGVSGVDCTRNPRFPVVRQLWPQLHDSLDGLFFDAYASPRTFGPGLEAQGPEQNDLDGMMREAIAIAKSRGVTKRIAIHEKGWDVDAAQPVNSTYARAFGDTIARSLIITRAIDEIDEYLYFMMCGSAIEGGRNYGLWQRQGADTNPTPGVTAFATAARLLDTATSARRVPLHKDIWTYVFKSPQRAVAAVWTPLPQDIAMMVALPASTRAVNVAGTPVPIPRAAGKANLTLTRSPLYLLDEQASPDALAKALAAASYNLPCAKLAVTIPNVRRLNVHVFPQIPATFEGRLSVKLPAGWRVTPPTKPCTLKPGAPAAVEFDLVMPPKPKRHPGAIDVVLQTTSHGRVALHEEPTFFVVPRLKQPVRIDGDLSEFASLPAIELETANDLGPSADPAANRLWTGMNDLGVQAWTAWDALHFYLAARIRDDVHSQRYDGSVIWAQDCLQIAFDPLNNGIAPATSGKVGFDPDDHEFGLALGPRGIVLHRWAGRDESARGNQSTDKLVVKRDGAATVYEWALPWSELAPLTPAAGTVFGMSFVTPDSDDKTWASYWMRLSQGIANGKTPAFYPNFVLGE